MIKQIEQDMIAEDDTLIITDPCYFIKEEHWSGFCNNECINDDSKCKEYLMQLGFSDRSICGSTGYGDWSNECYDQDGHSLGEFVADAGMVAVVTAHDLLHYSKESYDKMLEYCDRGLACIIPDYTGRLTYGFEYSKDNGKLAVIEGFSDDDFNFSSMHYEE